MVMARLAQVPLFASNTEAALNMFTCRYETIFPLPSLATSNRLPARHDTMLAFLKLLRDKYGGVENYLATYAGLSPEDVQQIRTNLLVPADNHPAASS